jgi:CRP-like cAMP-binding protein
LKKIFQGRDFEYQNLYDLEKGEIFGLEEFITEEERKLSIRAKEISNVLCISKSNFMKVLKEFPEDELKFH